MPHFLIPPASGAACIISIPRQTKIPRGLNAERIVSLSMWNSRLVRNILRWHMCAMDFQRDAGMAEIASGNSSWTGYNMTQRNNPFTLLILVFCAALYWVVLHRRSRRGAVPICCASRSLMNSQPPPLSLGRPEKACAPESAQVIIQPYLQIISLSYSSSSVLHYLNLIYFLDASACSKNQVQTRIVSLIQRPKTFYFFAQF